MNNRFHSEAKLPWSYDYPLANHIATNKSSANRERPLFTRLYPSFMYLRKIFPPRGLKYSLLEIAENRYNTLSGLGWECFRATSYATEPVYKDHLCVKTTFHWSLWWSLYVALEPVIAKYNLCRGFMPNPECSLKTFLAIPQYILVIPLLKYTL